MKIRSTLLILSIALFIATWLFVAQGVVAQPASPPSVRTTFDGSIKNNALAISPDEALAVVSNSDRSDVLVYDLKTRTLKATLSGYITPRNIVFSPSGKHVYISDSSRGVVDELETASLAVTRRFATGPGSFGTALSADARSLFVNVQAANAVVRVNLETGVASDLIPGFSQPRQGVRLSPDGKRLYVTNFLGDKITVVDTLTNKIAGEISGFDKIRAISVTSDGRTLFAANSGSNTIAVVDLARGSVTRVIPVGRNPYGASLSPDGREVFTGNLDDNTLSVIDVESLRVTATVQGFDEPRQAIVFSRDGQRVYVLNKDLSVSVVDRRARRIIETVAASASRA